MNTKDIYTKNKTLDEFVQRNNMTTKTKEKKDRYI